VRLRRPAGRRRHGRWLTIPNGVDVAGFTATTSVAPDAPLMFLGRLEPIKGAHHAIAIARLANRRLIIAGNKVPEFTAYFDEQIAPHIDGSRVNLRRHRRRCAEEQVAGAVGGVPDADRLGRGPSASSWRKAMACGTPVIAFNRGSVPDIVRDGINGFACATEEEAAGAVGRLNQIDRRRVRQDCEARFDASVIISQYEQLYDETIRKTVKR